MPYCCVPLCTSHGGRCNKDGQGPRISFHKIPKEPRLLRQFVLRIRRDIGPNFIITKNTAICSKHYKVEDFYCYNPPSGKRELKPGVLPSVFDFKLKPKHGKLLKKRVSSRRSLPRNEAVDPLAQDAAPLPSRFSDNGGEPPLNPSLLHLPLGDPVLIPPEDALNDIKQDPNELQRTAGPRDTVDELLYVLDDLKKEKMSLLSELEKERQARKHAEDELATVKFALEEAQRQLALARCKDEQSRSRQTSVANVKEKRKSQKFCSEEMRKTRRGRPVSVPRRLLD